MKTIMNKFFKVAVISSCLLISYIQASYANSGEYLSSWYEYKLQKAGDSIIDETTIKDIADNLADDKKAIYSLILDKNNLPPEAEALEQILEALKTNSTVHEISFYHFSSDDLLAITKTLAKDLFEFRENNNLRWIKSFSFANTSSASISKKAMEGIAELINKNLSDLCLDGNNIGLNGIVIIAKALPNSELADLSLNNNELDYISITPLVNALQKDKFTHKPFRSLSLSNNNIGEDTAIELTNALSYGYMENVNLSGNNIGSDAAVKILKSSLLNHRKFLNNNFHLDLSRNNIDTIGFEKMASIAAKLPHSKNISPFYLNLEGNNIDITAITNIWKNREQFLINIAGNKINKNIAFSLIESAPTKEAIEALHLTIKEESGETSDSKHDEL